MSADANMEYYTRQVFGLLQREFRIGQRFLRHSCVYAASLYMTATAFAAQSLVPDDVLLFRKREIADYLPVGIRAGSFLLSPGIGVSGTYDDNIFRTPANAQSDFITNIKPAFAAQSNWNRHGVFFGAEGDFGFYSDNHEENYEDYGVLLSGQYDFTEETYLIVATSRAKRHISRGSLLDPNATAPSEYEVDRQQFQLVRELGRLQLEFNGQNEDVRLSDTTNTGVPLTTFTTRDGQQLGAVLRYEYMPDNSLFVDSFYNTTDYTLAGGARRSADGYNIKSGIAFDTNSIFSGSFYGTYINRDYTANTQDTSRIFPGGSLSWDILSGTTLTGIYDTGFNDTTVAGAAGVLRTMRKLALQHQFTSRTRGEVSGGVNSYKYLGGEGSINRGTKVRYAGVMADYKLSEHAGLRAQYDFQKRSSPLASDAYRDNRVTLSVTYMY
ncbi:MAG: outer membrane beta-barrel protein [Alphaproteobacteria bacterium]